MSNLQPGHMLGPYQIISQIGKGGMATVYKAYHASMDRYVAIKVLSLQFAQSPEFIGRFRQEARLIAKLEHPHILPVYDFGECEGTPYLVMRFLEAGTLKDLLSSGAPPPEEIDRIFTQLADALQYAHENGVVHRDIKPTNVMLDKRGDVFLTDFGIAKLVEGSPQFTTTGAITGTPDYMSPEQAQGGNVDQRTDIYSLGIILYEMITGRVPYEADTPLAVILKKIQEPLPPPSTLKPGITPAIEAVVLKALAKEPTDRYQSTRELLHAWKHALAEAPVAKLPASTPSVPAPQLVPTRLEASVRLEPSIPAGKRRSLTCMAAIACGGLLGLAMLIGLGIWIASMVRGKAQPTQVAAAPTKTASLPTMTAPLPTETTPLPSRTPLVSTQTPVPPTPFTDSTQVFTPTPKSVAGWQSWTAANSIADLAIQGDSIYAAGVGGVTVWDRRTGDYWQITTLDGLPSSWVETVFVDNDGTLWLGTDSGLAHFDNQSWKIYTTHDGLDSDFISAITRIDGVLWVGTSYAGGDGNGLQTMDGSRFSQVASFPSTTTQSPDTVSYNITQIVEDTQGHIWIGTNDGLGMYDGSQWMVFDQSSGLPDPTIKTIFLDRDGQILIGTANSGIAWYKDGKFISNDLGEYNIYDVEGIVQDNQGGYWFSGGDLVHHLAASNEWEVFHASEGSLPLYGLGVSIMDEEGSIYFGTYGEGLVRYNGTFDVWKVPNAPSLAGYGTILPAPDGTLYFISNYTDQYDIFDPFNQTWSKSPTGETCCQVPILWDEDGNLWSGGYTGLWVAGSGGSVHITDQQGLPSEAVNVIAITEDGLAWIGTSTGLVTYDRKNIFTNQVPESTYLADQWIIFLKNTSDGKLWVGTQTGLYARLADNSWETYLLSELFGGYTDWVTDLVEDMDGNLWIATYGDGLYRNRDGAWERYLSTDPGVGLSADYLTSLAVATDGSLWIGTEGAGAVNYNGSAWQAYTGVSDGLIDLHVNDIYVDELGIVWFATESGVSCYYP